MKLITQFAGASVGLLLITALLACGGSPTAPSNPGAGTGPGTPPPPSPAPPPPPAPAPPPPPAPPRPPASSTIDILRSQGGDWSVARRNRPFADAFAGYDVRGRSGGGHAGRSYAEAAVFAGIGERPRARSWVYYDWDSAPRAYRVSAEVRWLGYLAGNGVGGSGAKVTYELEVRDFQGRLLASRTLHERELRESGLTLGGVKDEGTASAALDFTLPANTGGPFRIFLILTCEAYSGVFGADSLCLFGNTEPLGPIDLSGYAEWTALSVTTFQ
jgi:hypothetical protein